MIFFYFGYTEFDKIFTKFLQLSKSGMEGEEMGYRIHTDRMNEILEIWQENAIIYAPRLFRGEGEFSDTDSIRYGEITKIEEIVFDQKSAFSFKEILLPLSETLFYFTEDLVKEADASEKKIIIFLRSCDLHGVRRLDQMYLENGAEDYYYARIRSQIHFVLMGCESAFENCFCVDMESNVSTQYDGYIEKQGQDIYADIQKESWKSLFAVSSEEEEVRPKYVAETKVRVQIPDILSPDVMKASLWEQYDKRCIACGRCNFVCPTCTCFTMQDIFYTDNARSGERRRVQASCMVDGFTDVAGGGSYRQKNGQRMRFKTLHKVYDYKKRNGYHMCVGCGRCDDVCPEYISFSHIINQLGNAMEEVNQNEK